MWSVLQNNHYIGSKKIPNEVLSQLKVGGKMIVTIRGDVEQEMISINRESEKKFVKKAL